MYEKSYPSKRFQITQEFLEEHLDKGSHILDLGITNPFSDIMEQAGYIVSNTTGEDLDLDQSAVNSPIYDAITAFQILEHLVAPYLVLKEIKARKLFASVPLDLWFSPAYRNPDDERDRHFHEFEDWQFDWLLEKAGWEIKDRRKFTNPVGRIGVRPLLRSIVPRHYLVYAERI